MEPEPMPVELECFLHAMVEAEGALDDLVTAPMAQRQLVTERAYVALIWTAVKEIAERLMKLEETLTHWSTSEQSTSWYDLEDRTPPVAHWAMQCDMTLALCGARLLGLDAPESWAICEECERLNREEW